MSITKKPFGTFGGKTVFAWTLTNKSGAYVTILNYGGIMQSLVLPDKNGKMADVVCGFDDLDGYITERKQYFGALIGRCGNRISNGTFSIGKEKYYVAGNEKPEIGLHLHGGNVGFNRKIWDVRPIEGEGSDSLVLKLFSPDMEEGYPGNLKVKVTYTFDDDNALTISYYAKSDKKTYVNLTSHTYYNLNGYDGGSVMDQELMLNCDCYDEVDADLVPVEKPIPVDGTAFDFRKPKKIGIGYDHNFHINGEAGTMRLAASVYDPESGRTMDIITDQPAVQLYTAVGMGNETNFKGNVPERKLHALCLETQNPPDLPNRKSLPQRFTFATKPYKTTTIMKFGIKK